jgi:hypothetical protein
MAKLLAHQRGKTVGTFAEVHRLRRHLLVRTIQAR